MPTNDVSPAHGKLTTLLLPWDSGPSLYQSSAGAACLDRWEKQGPQYLWPLLSPLTCQQEPRVIEMLAPGLILAPLLCTLCLSQQTAHHRQTPQALSGLYKAWNIAWNAFPWPSQLSKPHSLFQIQFLEHLLQGTSLGFRCSYPLFSLSLALSYSLPATTIHAGKRRQIPCLFLPNISFYKTNNPPHTR